MLVVAHRGELLDLAHGALGACAMPCVRMRLRGGEDDAAFHARMLAEFDAFLDAHAHELGELRFALGVAAKEKALLEGSPPPT